MAFEVEAKVLENRFVSGITWEIRLEAESIAKTTQPGQFVMLSTHVADNGEYDPLNRRPFAVADVEGSEISIFYDVVGRGTRKLTLLRRGNRVHLLGPLGNGVFPTEGVKKAVVVAGGIGASGVSLLVKRLAEKGIPTVVLYGARSKEFLSMRDWYDQISQRGVEVRYYTDDGSFGKKGFPVEDLDEFVELQTVVYACGPKPLLRYLKDYSRRRGVKTYLSLDRRMACGWGVCLGCVIKTDRGFERVCKEGPVFEASRIVEL